MGFLQLKRLNSTSASGGQCEPTAPSGYMLTWCDIATSNTTFKSTRTQKLKDEGVRTDEMHRWRVCVGRWAHVQVNTPADLIGTLLEGEACLDIRLLLYYIPR